VRVFASILVVTLLTACNSTPADLRPWRPSDHDHTSEPGNNQVVGGPDAGVDPELAANGLNEVVLVAWEQNCVRCHGRFGRGDGPQGPMTRAADLANSRFQSTATDAQILATIRDGRGLMPAFPLPEPTLTMLVQLIRLLGQAATRMAEGAPTAPNGAAPATSAGHPAPVASGKAPSNLAGATTGKSKAAPAAQPPVAPSPAASSR
jgi:cytochrome c oxidase cbb3-type subunit 3